MTTQLHFVSVTLGTLVVQGNATFMGDVVVAGEFAVSNQQAGTARIPAGGTAVTVSYTAAFTQEPLVQVTPKGESSGHWVAEESKNGFTIRLAAPLPHELSFNWLSLSAVDPQLTVGEGGNTGSAEAADEVEAESEAAAAEPVDESLEAAAGSAEPVPAAEEPSVPAFSEATPIEAPPQAPGV